MFERFGYLLQIEALCKPPNKQLQRTVRDKVPLSYVRCPAAELRR
jgi:hypothetical protein